MVSWPVKGIDADRFAQIEKLRRIDHANVEGGKAILNPDVVDRTARKAGRRIVTQRLRQIRRTEYRWLVIVRCCDGGPSPCLFVNTSSRFWPNLG